MAIDKTEIEKIAHLARLQIEQSAVDAYKHHLNGILALVDQMQVADTSGIEPMAHPLEATQRLRPDNVTEQDKRAHYQRIAPLTENGLYLVPKVIE